MAGFGRSHSLSINTGATNSLFANQSQSQPAQQQQQQGGGLFGSTTGAQSQAQQPKNLFEVAQQTSGPTLFSLATGTTAQPQQSGGLFSGLGQSQQQQQQPQQPQQPQQQQQAGSSLFGSLGQSQNQNQSQPGQQQGGLFSGLGQQSKPAAPSLFSLNTGQNQQQKPSLFGSTNAAPQQQAPSLFASSQAPTGQQQAPSLFGSAPLGQSTFGTNAALSSGLKLGQSTTQPQQPQQQQTVPGVKVDLSNMRGTTRFSDLHPDVQREIEGFDAFIAQQIGYSEQIAALLPGHAGATEQVPHDAAFVAARVDAVELALDNDGAAIARLKATLRAHADDARRLFRAVETLKLPAPFHYHGGGLAKPADPAAAASAGVKTGAPGPAGSGPGHHDPTTVAAAARAAALADPAAADLDDLAGPADLVAYFERRSAELTARLGRYQDQVTEIEGHLRMVEATTAQEAEVALASRRAAAGATDARGRDAALRELAGTLRDFEQAVLRVAGHVGAAREGLVEASVGAAGRGR